MGVGACGGQASTPVAPAVTFSADIAPIVFERCAPCHRPGEAGPFPLLDYAQVRRRATQIVEVTRRRFMPPWQPEPGHGEFVGERRLTDAQIETFRRWADAGAPEGDPGRTPPLPTFTDGWQLGQPDLVVTMPVAMDVPAEGTDVFRKFAVPVPLNERRYVRGIEFRPDNPRVVHHAVLRVDRRRSGYQREILAEDPGEGGMLFGEDTAESPDGHFMGWTPGHAPWLDDERISWPLDPDTELVFELHLQPTGKPETITARVGFFFSRNPPTISPVAIQLGSYDIDIPAGEPRYTIRDEYVLPVDVDVRRVYPHAHYLGKEIKAFATLPDGSTRWLVRIDNWDFNWQDEYRFVTPLPLPKGTRVTMEYVYDNSAANPRNPTRPPKRVRYGGTSSDEMGNLWMQVLPRNPADRQALRNDWDRKALLRRTAGLERLLETNSGHAGMLRSLGTNYLALGSVERAVPLLIESTRIDGDDPHAHYNLGNALAARGDIQGATAAYRRAVALQPDYGDALNNLALMLRAQGRAAEALATLERAVAVAPDFAPAHNNLGSAYRALRRTADARRELAHAIRLAPDFADAHANLGALLASTGDIESAVAPYRRAIELDAGHVGAVSALAWILATHPAIQPTTPQEPLMMAERAVQLTARRDPSALDTLGAALARAGRFDEAIKAATDARTMAAAARETDLAVDIDRRLSLYRQRRTFAAR